MRGGEPLRRGAGDAGAAREHERGKRHVLQRTAGHDRQAASSPLLAQAIGDRAEDEPSQRRGGVARLAARPASARRIVSTTRRTAGVSSVSGASANASTLARVTAQPWSPSSLHANASRTVSSSSSACMSASDASGVPVAARYRGLASRARASITASSRA